MLLYSRYFDISQTNNINRNERENDDCSLDV